MENSLNIVDTKIPVGSRLLEGCIAISEEEIVKVGKRLPCQDHGEIVANKGSGNIVGARTPRSS